MAKDITDDAVVLALSKEIEFLRGKLEEAKDIILRQQMRISELVNAKK